MKASTTSATLMLSSLILGTGAISLPTFGSLKSVEAIGQYYNQVDDATLSLKSNATHFYDYALKYDDGRVEVNHITVPVETADVGSDAGSEILEKRDDRCFNNVNKSKGAGCPVNKGLGYYSAHNCKNKGGKMYSCQIKCPDGEGGDDCYTEECIKVKQAAGLEGGYCYN